MENVATYGCLGWPWRKRNRKAVWSGEEEIGKAGDGDMVDADDVRKEVRPPRIVDELRAFAMTAEQKRETQRSRK